jgi:NADH-quinone oxidoreductase subunit G
MAKLTVDDQEYDVADGNNLLHACLSIGLDLPYFCWHPCMGSIGACRQCAVTQYQDENDERGRVVMACMTPASEGARISIDNKQAKDFRAGVIELLMTNHPHDCPVCEEGGECHLQDMTEMSGHTTRVYEEKKRTHHNQYLGPFINHEMNRCISCYRCVRYYKDYAGGHDLDAMGAHHHVYFGRHSDGVLESPFAGNLVEVCPTGVFTDKTFSEHYSRKWDLQTAPSICQHCAVGCNITPGERYGTLKRITNRYNAEVNGYFLCDRGRFGYGFVNSKERITQPLVREKITHADHEESATAIQCSLEDSIRRLNTALASQTTIAIGSPRASLESNFALQAAVGKENFFRGVSDKEGATLDRILEVNNLAMVSNASLETIEECDAVLILGEDLTHSAPRIALSLRQTVRQKAKEIAEQARIPFWQDAAVRELSQREKSPLFIVNVSSTDLDDIAEDTLFTAPNQVARFGFAISERIHGEFNTVFDSLNEEEQALCVKIADCLSQAKKPLIISGASLQNPSLIEGAYAVISALHQRENKAIDAHFAVPEVNTVGLGLLCTQGLEEALSRIKNGSAKRLIVLENDLYRRVNAETLDPVLEQLDELIVIDHCWHKTAAKADLILPAATFAESDGSVVSSEGRAQRFFATFPVDAQHSSATDSWQWINLALAKRWKNFDDLVDECAGNTEIFFGLNSLSPNAEYRQHGLKVPRMSHRASGRTAIFADRNVSEPKQAVDTQSALGFTMEGTQQNVPSSLRNTSWAPGWNSNQSVHKFQDEVGGALLGGSSGIRLFGHRATSIKNVSPPAEHDINAGFCAFPLYHIFGSDELSNLAAPVVERVPQAYLALSGTDADQLNLRCGDGVILSLDDHHQTFCLEVLIKPEMSRGLVGLPMGLGGLHPGVLDHPISIEKDPNWRRRPSSSDEEVFATDQMSLQEGGS